MADEPKEKPEDWSFVHHTTETIARAPKMIVELTDLDIANGAMQFAMAVKQARDVRKKAGVAQGQST